MTTNRVIRHHGGGGCACGVSPDPLDRCGGAAKPGADQSHHRIGGAAAGHAAQGRLLPRPGSRSLVLVLVCGSGGWSGSVVQVQVCGSGKSRFVVRVQVYSSGLSGGSVGFVVPGLWFWAVIRVSAGL